MFWDSFACGWVNFICRKLLSVRTQGNYRNFSERWLHMLLLAEWDHLCSVDRRISSGGKGEGRAAESRFFEDRWGQVVSATFGRQRPCRIVCVVSQQFWDWTQTPKCWVTGHKWCWWLLRRDGTAAYIPPLLHVAELRLFLENWVNLRQCKVLILKILKNQSEASEVRLI